MFLPTTLFVTWSNRESANSYKGTYPLRDRQLSTALVLRMQASDTLI